MRRHEVTRVNLPQQRWPEYAKLPEPDRFIYSRAAILTRVRSSITRWRGSNV